MIMPLQSKVSGSPMKRLTRKDRSRRGQQRASDHHHNGGGSSGSCSLTCQSEITGPQLLLRRHTLLFEDQLDWAPHCHRDCMNSWPDFNSDVPVSLPRPLRQAADKEPPAPSAPSGQFHGFFPRQIVLPPPAGYSLTKKICLSFFF